MVNQTMLSAFYLNMTIIRPIKQADLQAVADIYNGYITDSVATFEEQEINVAELKQRVTQVNQHQLPWLVAELDGDVVGYCYAAPWKPRSAYRFSVEVTVYLAEDAFGRGIGTALYNELFPLLASMEIHSAQAGISLPNNASVKLHEKMGMSKVAHFSQIGFKFGQWIDVGYWQRVF